MNQPVIERLLTSKQEERAARRKAATTIWEKSAFLSVVFAPGTITHDEIHALTSEDQEPTVEIVGAAITEDYVEGEITVWPAAEQWERTIRARDLSTVPEIFKFGGGPTTSVSPEEQVAEFVSLREPTVEERFKSLAARWLAETRFTSSTHEMVLHPAYQQIIGLGEPALPLLIRELDEGPRQWFWALRSIAGEDPAEGVDSVADAAAAWRQWASQRGYGG
jgi:hypothetical protein